MHIIISTNLRAICPKSDVKPRVSDTTLYAQQLLQNSGGGTSKGNIGELKRAVLATDHRGYLDSVQTLTQPACTIQGFTKSALYQKEPLIIQSSIKPARRKINKRAELFSYQTGPWKAIFSYCCRPGIRMTQITGESPPPSVPTRACQKLLWEKLIRRLASERRICMFHGAPHRTLFFYPTAKSY